MSLPAVRACIFDVDGLLINSEDIYTEAYNRVLGKYGKPDFPWKIKALQQSRGQGGAQRIIDWAKLPLSVAEWKVEVQAHHHLFSQSMPLPGVIELLHNLSSRTKNPLQLAIGSSSSAEMFQRKTGSLPQLTSYIPSERCVFGNDPDMAGKRKKPAPDLFRIALERINKVRQEEIGNDTHDLILPAECLVFEDSIAGVEAARKAGMRVVWIPHPGLRETSRGHEETVLAGQISNDLVELEPTSIEPAAERIKSKDGWAEMLPTLENFPYADYGLNIHG